MNLYCFKKKLYIYIDAIQYAKKDEKDDIANFLTDAVIKQKKDKNREFELLKEENKSLRSKCSNHEEQIATLMEKIKQLEERIAKLEGNT